MTASRDLARYALHEGAPLDACNALRISESDARDIKPDDKSNTYFSAKMRHAELVKCCKQAKIELPDPEKIP
jgi:hypothetical protein